MNYTRTWSEQAPPVSTAAQKPQKKGERFMESTGCKVRAAELWLGDRRGQLATGALTIGEKMRQMDEATWSQLGGGHTVVSSLTFLHSSATVY